MSQDRFRADDQSGLSPPDDGEPLAVTRERARPLRRGLELAAAAGGTTVRLTVPLVKRAVAADRIRLLVVEDHTAVRESLAAALEREAGFEIAGQAATLAEARSMLERVDVAVVAMRLSDGYGCDLIADLRAASPGAAVLVLGARLDRSAVARAIQRGAAGVLGRDAHLPEVVDAVRRVSDGETLLPLADMVELLRLAGQEREREFLDREAIASLTPRERDVLQLLAEGYDSRRSAAQLHISVRTQRNHMTSILGKLGVHSQLQALLFALRYDLVTLRRGRA